MYRSVRRHINWNTWQPDLREDLAHLVDMILGNITCLHRRDPPLPLPARLGVHDSSLTRTSSPSLPRIINTEVLRVGFIEFGKVGSHPAFAS